MYYFIIYPNFFFSSIEKTVVIYHKRIKLLPSLVLFLLYYITNAILIQELKTGSKSRKSEKTILDPSIVSPSLFHCYTILHVVPHDCSCTGRSNKGCISFKIRISHSLSRCFYPFIPSST